MKARVVALVVVSSGLSCAPSWRTNRGGYPSMCLNLRNHPDLEAPSDAAIDVGWLLERRWQFGAPKDVPSDARTVRLLSDGRLEPKMLGYERWTLVKGQLVLHSADGKKAAMYNRHQGYPDGSPRTLLAADSACLVGGPRVDVEDGDVAAARAHVEAHPFDYAAYTRADDAAKRTAYLKTPAGQRAAREREKKAKREQAKAAARVNRLRTAQGRYSGTRWFVRDGDGGVEVRLELTPRGEVVSTSPYFQRWSIDEDGYVKIEGKKGVCKHIYTGKSPHGLPGFSCELTLGSNKRLYIIEEGNPTVVVKKKPANSQAGRDFARRQAARLREMSKPIYEAPKRVRCSAGQPYVCGADNCCSAPMCCGGACFAGAKSCPWGHPRTEARSAR